MPMEYSQYEWRKSALEDKDRSDDEFAYWDDFSSQSDYDELNLRTRDDNRWFYFHIEAAAQRRHVLASIPGLADEYLLSARPP